MCSDLGLGFFLSFVFVAFMPMTTGNLAEVLRLVVGSISTPNELTLTSYESIETHNKLHV